MQNTLSILSQYFCLILFLILIVTVFTIYLSNLVELFIVCCSGASLPSFCTFIQFLILIYYYYAIMFKLLLQHQDASSTH